MRALITGIAGFIGSHLAERYLERGVSVTGIDDFTAGTMRNVQGIQGRATILAGSVRKMLRRHRPDDAYDIVFHLAARIGVGQILANPLRMVTEHTADTEAVCRAAMRWGATLVLTSSSEVYANGYDLRETEALTVGPTQASRSGYAVTKLLAEHYGLAFHRRAGLRVVIPRLFNVSGARQRAEGGCVLPTWARAALGGGLIVIHGDGQQVRCFSHVSDVTTALMRLAECPRANGEIVNVGSTHQVRVVNLADAVGAHCETISGAKPRFHYQPYQSIDFNADVARMQARVPNVDLLENLTGMRFADQTDAIVRDVCTDQWQQRKEARSGRREQDRESTAALAGA